MQHYRIKKETESVDFSGVDVSLARLIGYVKSYFDPENELTTYSNLIIPSPLDAEKDWKRILNELGIDLLYINEVYEVFLQYRASRYFSRPLTFNIVAKILDISFNYGFIPVFHVITFKSESRVSMPLEELLDNKWLIETFYKDNNIKYDNNLMPTQLILKSASKNNHELSARIFHIYEYEDLKRFIEWEVTDLITKAIAYHLTKFEDFAEEPSVMRYLKKHEMTRVYRDLENHISKSSYIKKILMFNAMIGKAKERKSSESSPSDHSLHEIEELEPTIVPETEQEAHSE